MYTLEILPFSLRAKGFTVFAFSLTASLVFNQYINPIALAALQWKYYIFYCVWLAFELVYVYLFVVETKNRTLEETAVYVSCFELIAELTSRCIFISLEFSMDWPRLTRPLQSWIWKWQRCLKRAMTISVPVRRRRNEGKITIGIVPSTIE